ncbi:MAG: hypothetical protein ABL986_17010 [Vicinamibacterales bacterium]
MSLKNRVAGVLTLVALVSGVGLDAQAIKEGELANIKSLKCTFPTSTIVAWKDGVPEARIRTTGVLNIEINEIDAADGSAIVGAVSTGNHDVNVQVYGWNMHFLEVSRGGRMGVTTVFAQTSTGDKLKAVHSRTDYLPIDLPGLKSEPEVAMYYGDCVATR